MPADQQLVPTNGVTLATTVAGAGPAVLLVHGFPHTRRLWSAVLPDLATSWRVIAPDLRGTGESTRAHDGYDAANLSKDLLGLLDALDVESTAVVAIDAGVPPAFLLALQHPERVRALVLMESTLGNLPGAESFFSAGAPWWFGFHQVPGLAETVLAGHEGDYLDFFYRAGTHDHLGLPDEVRDAFVAAYSGAESLRCGFEYYRAMSTSTDQIRAATADRRLQPPTLAIGSQPVADTLAHQLEALADDLRSARLDDTGHIIPLDNPSGLIALLRSFL